ncbi:MAG: PAS domain S-box protein [Tenuifilaceae bacterium]
MNNSNKMEQIREKIADYLLLVGMIMAIPGTIISGYRIFTMGLRTLFVADILIGVLLIIFYLTRSKTNYRTRMLFLIGYVFGLGVLSINTFGLFSMGLVIIFFSCIVITSLFGLRYGLFTLSVSIFVFIYFTLGIYFKWISFDADFNALSYSTYQWILRGVFYLTYSSIAIVTLGMVHKNFEKINNELAESDSRFDLTLESVNEAIWDYNPKSESIFVSKKFYELLGYNIEDLPMKFESWKNLIHNNDIEMVNKAIRNHLLGISPTINLEYRIKNKSGGWQWFITKGKIVQTDENTGKPLRIVGTHSDISLRKRMEESIVESEERYRMLFELANDSILLIRNDRIINCNIRAVEMFLNSYDELTGKNLLTLSPELQPDGTLSKIKLAELFLDVKSSNSKKFEWEFIKSDEKIIDTLVSLSVFYDKEQPIYYAIIHDITEQKQFEQAKFNAILETEEKERLKFAGDLHDEVGPLLSSLNMYLSLVNRPNTENKGEILDNMQDILKETIHSVREISNNLSPHTLNNHGLATAVRVFIDSKRNLLEIYFNENLGSERLSNNLEVICYRIIKELLNNTLKYANAKSVEINLLLDNKKLYFSYKDDGIGFNWKETISSQHSGIGLANIINRVNSIKANYSIESEPGKGFKFEMNHRIN